MKTMPTATERTRATSLQEGDIVLLQYDQWRYRPKGAPELNLVFSGPRPPRRAFWAPVVRVNRVPGMRSLKSIAVAIDGTTVLIDGDLLGRAAVTKADAPCAPTKASGPLGATQATRQAKSQPLKGPAR